MGRFSMRRHPPLGRRHCSPLLLLSRCTSAEMEDPVPVRLQPSGAFRRQFRESKNPFAQNAPEKMKPEWVLPLQTHSGERKRQPAAFRPRTSEPPRILDPTLSENRLRRCRPHETHSRRGRSLLPVHDE